MDPICSQVVSIATNGPFPVMIPAIREGKDMGGILMWGRYKFWGSARHDTSFIQLLLQVNKINFDRLTKNFKN